MWDLTNGKLLRTILDAHPPGSAVLHIKVNLDIIYCDRLYFLFYLNTKIYSSLNPFYKVNWYISHSHIVFNSNVLYYSTFIILEPDFIRLYA